MPHVNMGIYGDRLFPIQYSDSKKTFRAYLNPSSSITRIITISSDPLYGNHGSIKRIGFKAKKQKSEPLYEEIDIEPNSGYDAFFEKVQSLELMDFKVTDSINQGSSLVVVELKIDNEFNSFKFKYNLRDEDQNHPSLKSIHDFVIEEFKN